MAVLNRVCANDVDTAVGRVVYTQWLDDRGGIIADVTVTRLAEDTVRRDQRRHHPPPGAGLDPPADPRRRVPHRHRRDQRPRAAVGAGAEVARGAAAAEPGRLVRRRLPVPHRAEGRARLHPAVGAAGDLRRRAGLGPAGADRVRRHALRPAARGRRRPGLPPDRRRRAGDDAAGEGVPRHGPRHRLHRHPARGRARLRGRLGQARRLRRA